MAGVQDTPLKVVRNHLIPIIIYSSFTRLIISLFFLISILFSIAEIWYFLYEFSIDVLFQYCQYACFTSFTFFEYYVIITSNPVLKRLLKYQEETYIAIDEASTATKLKITQESRIFMAWCWIFLFFLTSLSCIFISIAIGEHCQQTFLPYYFLRQYIKNQLLRGLLHGTILTYEVSSILLTMFLVIVVYFIQTLRFELYLLQDKLQAICDVRDERKIREALVFIIRHHEKVKRSHALLLECFSISMFTWTLLGVILNYIYLSTMIMRRNEFPFAFNFWLAMSCQHATLFICHRCQQIENDSERVYDLCGQVPWYNWNQQSKTLYKIFLLHVSKRLKMSFTTEISLNYDRLIVIIKCLFAGANVLYTLSAKRSKT